MMAVERAEVTELRMNTLPPRNAEVSKSKLPLFLSVVSMCPFCVCLYIQNNREREADGERKGGGNIGGQETEYNIHINTIHSMLQNIHFTHMNMTE
jgi:hypothetical protein